MQIYLKEIVSNYILTLTKIVLYQHSVHTQILPPSLAPTSNMKDILYSFSSSISSEHLNNIEKQKVIDRKFSHIIRYYKIKKKRNESRHD